MTYLGAVHDGAVLDLHSVSHPDVVADARRGPDVAVRSDIAVLSNQNRAYDIGSRSDGGTLADGYIPLQRRAGLNLAMDSGQYIREQNSIRGQDVPGPADLQPALELYYPDRLAGL